MTHGEERSMELVRTILLLGNRCVSNLDFVRVDTGKIMPGAQFGKMSNSVYGALILQTHI